MRREHKDVLTQGEWDKIEAANRRAEKKPDPKQQMLPGFDKKKPVKRAPDHS